MGNGNLDTLYRDVILEHNRSPRNTQPLAHSTLTAEGHNPVCGDRLHLELELDENGRIKNICADCHGCSISVSSGSIMTEEVIGKTLDEAEGMVEQFREMMRGGDIMQGETGELPALEGVKSFPARIKCALLPWATLWQGIEQYRCSRGEKFGAASDVGPAKTE